MRDEALALVDRIPDQGVREQSRAFTHMLLARLALDKNDLSTAVSECTRALDVLAGKVDFLELMQFCVEGGPLLTQLQGDTALCQQFYAELLHLVYRILFLLYAEQRGMGAVIHNQTLGIASAMQAHLAAAKHHSLGHATELFGHVMMEDDLIVDPIDYSDGTATLPAGPGWGVELDEDALKKYATVPTARVEAK